MTTDPALFTSAHLTALVYGLQPAQGATHGDAMTLLAADLYELVKAAREQATT